MSKRMNTFIRFEIFGAESIRRKVVSWILFYSILLSGKLGK
jgi:hypothetical protein